MARRKSPSVLHALNAALREAETSPLDAATIALAKRYAVELDESAVVAQALVKTLAKIREQVDSELFFEISKLAARIEEAHVAGLIGPKLLATLEQLQLTPKARAGVMHGGGGGNAGDPAKRGLDELRSRRANRAATVDPSA